MSGKERGVFQLIYKHFIASITPKSKQRVLIGEDYYGTKYYEVQGKDSVKKNPTRYFVPVNKDDYQQEIPTEWEAWLRHRRKFPPAVEEIQRNHEMQITKKENAAKLEAKYSGNRSEEASLSTEREERKAFPIYEEYKNHGQDYKIKYQK